ncbi:hypothetical protein [Cerasicoccus fimbriatus]|uniref:hypothetical protein n=1 Tax=Cerasicoccus fimbriatus TaxID=3014554 RepID=UPI0022B3DF7C|nr:hypothetical protein [Cerasicoccus sp. TK19100]
MNPEQPNQPGGQPRQINLQQMAQQLMGGLQRHYDMLSFNLAAHDCITEEAYNTRTHATKMMPAPPAHQNFEQMQAFAADIMMRNVLGDMINLCIAGLNNYHMFLAAIKAQKDHGQTPEAQQQVQQAQQAFAQAQVDAKFNTLEENYGILCELEDTIISIGFAIQAMMQHQGVIQQAHLDDQGELGFDLKTVEIMQQPAEGQPGQARLVDQRKVLREGEKVNFSKDELQQLVLTVGSFLDTLFKSVGRYAQENAPQQPGS